MHGQSTDPQAWPTPPATPATGPRIGLAVLGGVLLMGLVVGGALLLGRHQTTQGSKADLAAGYLAVVEPANQALASYLGECGCADRDGSVAGSLRAMPAYLAAKQTEADALTRLAEGAPEPVASDLRAMAEYERELVASGQAITALGLHASDAQLGAAFHDFSSAQAAAANAGSTVRADLGLPAGGNVEPTHPA